MDNFMYYAPTRVIFGRGTENEAGNAVKREGGSRVFVVYGGGSVVRSGLLARVEKSLADAGLAYESFGGVKPNPTAEHAEEGRAKAEAFGADFILGVGGGSVLDTSKAIAHGVANPGVPLWEFWSKKLTLTKSTPVGAVLTIAAAGSEMSDSAVLTYVARGFKGGLSTEFNRCRFAIMNPELLFTVPKYQLAAGVTDIMMHTMERYFIPEIKCDMTDEIAEGLLRTVVKNGRLILENPENYDAMAEVMWCSSLSHNGITECGRGKDFSVHKFGHALSALYDYTHGATLSAVWRAWAEYLYRDEPKRFSQYARKVWGVEEEDDLKAAEAGIEKTVAYFKEIGMPTSIEELGVVPSEEELDKLADMASAGKKNTLTRIKPVRYPEIREIFAEAVLNRQQKGRFC